MKFLFNYATRSRPDKFTRGMKSIMDNLSGNHEFEIVVIVDVDDLTMDEHLIEYENTTYYIGESKNKIHAINREIPNFPDDWGVIINMSDDMVFTAIGFDEIIAKDVAEIGTTDCYLHYRDINHKQKDALCTLHIVGKEYFDRDDEIYDNDFISVYADNWNDYKAKSRGKYHFFDTVIFKHFHCAYGLSERDEQYKRTEDRKVYARDRKTYQKKIKECTRKA